MGVFAASLLVLIFGSNWRSPFIISGIIVGLLGVYFRRNLIESPLFLEIKAQKLIEKTPFVTILKNFPRALLFGILISAYAGVAILVIEIYLPSYLQTNLGFSHKHALQISTYLALIESGFAVLWGVLSDYLGRKNIIIIAGVLMVIGIFPAFSLFHLSLIFWILGVTLLAFIVGAIDGPTAAFLAESFPLLFVTQVFQFVIILAPL